MIVLCRCAAAEWMINVEKIIDFGLIRVVLIAIGTLLTLNGIINTLLTRVNVGANILIAVSIGMIIYAIIFPKMPSFIHVIAGIAFIIPVLFIIFLLIYGNTAKVDYNEDVIIVMGAGVIGERVTRPLAYRLDKAVEYLEENPNAVAVVCGGLGENATITEAEAMKKYMITRGIAGERILEEGKSVNSYENLFFAKGILDPYFPYGFKAAVITSDYHIFRSSYLASKVGMSVNHLGAITPIESIPSSYIRELLSIGNMIVFQPWR